MDSGVEAGGGGGSGVEGVVIVLLRVQRIRLSLLSLRATLFLRLMCSRDAFRVGQWRTGVYDLLTCLCLRRRQGLNTQCSPPSPLPCCKTWRLVSPYTCMYVSPVTFFYGTVIRLLSRPLCALRAYWRL